MVKIPIINPAHMGLAATAHMGYIIEIPIRPSLTGENNLCVLGSIAIR